MADTERRRRRIRHTGIPAPDGIPAPELTEHPSAHTSPVHDPEAEPADRAVDDREAERGLRGLIGAGTSQVSRVAALRARDAARPTAADLAAAETDLVIVRRGWVPRDPLSR